MISAPLSLISRTLLLGDVQTLEKLLNNLIDDPSIRHNKIDVTITEVIEARYPRLYRPNEMDLAYQRLNQCDVYDLTWLENLFDEYFVISGDSVFAQSNRPINYAQLCAQIDPSLPVAWKLSGLINATGQGKVDINDLCRIVEAATTYFLPFDKHRIWADLHVHLGGAYESSINFLSRAFKPISDKSPSSLPSADHEKFALKRYRQWGATYQMLFKFLASTPNFIAIKDNDSEFFGNYDVVSSLRMAWNLGHIDRPLFKPAAWLSLHQPSIDNPAQRLVHAAIWNYQQANPQIAWLYWLTSLCLQYRFAKDNRCQDAILAFFHLIQLFRRDMIHDGIGLSRFVRYFQSAIRKAAPDRDQNNDALRQLLNNENQRAELKVTSWIANKSQALSFIQNGAQLVGDRRIASIEIAPFLQRMHCCIHFLRDKDKVKNRFRHDGCRQMTIEQAQKINAFMASASAARATLRDRRTGEYIALDLTRLIRCLDVAGDELVTPIEVYAPAIRWLRRGPRRSNALNYKPARGLHLSIHAGEDFNHLLGGLRHIDETVRFCEMTQHDRLGHALALGIPPKLWFDRIKEVFVTVEEHLDNLVWAWRQSQELAGKWAHSFAVTMRLEARIRIYAPLVYPDYKDGLSPDVLYQAWLLRRNCPHKWQKFQSNGTEYHDLQYWAPDADKPHAKADMLVYKLFFQHTKKAEIKSNSINQKSIILIKLGDQLPSIESPLNDWISTTELDFIEVLQDHLIDIYSRKGVAIEVNLSSNIFISRIEDYHLHPIFRWHPPRDEWLKSGEKFNRFGVRRGIMPVCINTDDPGIFPTTLTSEFNLLKEAALKYHEIGPTEADCWIETLRQTGVDRFLTAHDNVLLD